MQPGLLRRLRRREEVVRKLCTWLARLRRGLGRVSLVVFGSYARGDFNAWSDVDAILVWEGFEGVSVRDRWKLLKPYLEAVDEPLDLIPWSPGEAREMLERPAWRKALKDCLILADDYNIFGVLGCRRVDCQNLSGL